MSTSVQAHNYSGSPAVGFNPMTGVHETKAMEVAKKLGAAAKAAGMSSDPYSNSDFAAVLNGAYDSLRVKLEVAFRKGWAS